LSRPAMPPLPLLRGQEVIQEQPDLAALTERYVEQCVQFMRENRGRHFFLYFAHMHVHSPILAPKNFLDRSKNGRYGAGVEQIDWASGVILDELKRLGIDDDTLVVFTSDNGSCASGDGGSNAPLRGKKGTTWEGGQRVPCLMRWPKAIPSGVECSEIVTCMDFYETFAKLAQVEVPKDRKLDSVDISDLMFNRKAGNAPRDTFCYYFKNSLEAVRHGEWKLHVRKGDQKIKELYNLETDVGETRNLHQDNPEVVKRLETLLDQCRRDLGDSSEGITGANCRPSGRVDNPKPLTSYDPGHPYIDALYDCGK